MTSSDDRVLRLNPSTERWLAQLPRAQEDDSEGAIVLMGTVLPVPPHHVAVMTADLALVFQQDDVECVEEVAADESLRPRCSRVVIRPGSALIQALPRECLDWAQPEGPLPFAVLARQTQPRLGAMPRFRALEERFRFGTGREDDPDHR